MQEYVVETAVNSQTIVIYAYWFSTNVWKSFPNPVLFTTLNHTTQLI